MKHIFDISVAKECGVHAAIVLENIGYWVKENEANQRNFFDDAYWVYNSKKAYTEIFPYMSERQIDLAFRKLKENGYVTSGNYNKSAYDRTLWYTLTDKGKMALFCDISPSDKKMNSISPKSKMDFTEKGNGLHEKVRPIPNINTDINTDINNRTSTEVLTPSEPEEEEKRPSPKEVVELFKTICKSYPKPKSMSEARAKAIKARQKQYTDDEFREMFEKAEASAFLKGANDRNWSATFDWLMCDRNFGRVIDGNYDNGKVGYNPKKGAKETDDEWMQRMLREFAEEEEGTDEGEVLPY